MMGKLLNLFIQDGNIIFVGISVIFSGLTVVSVYYLGKEIFNKKIGTFAALVAMTSPNIWFHGEIALTYIVEAFFSTFIALLCWKIYKGNHRYIWLSVIALALAGGIRQNTMIFLFPLWLFAVKGVAIRKIAASLGILIVACLLWFVPMVTMTGGLNSYQEAFSELWRFHTGRVSVFKKGLDSIKAFSSQVSYFTLYGIGAGVFSLGLAIVFLVIKRDVISVNKKKLAFFSLWIVPSLLFFLLIFFSSTCYGYVLIYLPALVILIALSAEYIDARFKKFMRKDVSIHIIAAIILVNTAFFFFSNIPVSYHEIKSHNDNLPIFLEHIKSYAPDKTAIFIPSYTNYGYRQIMYYMPEYNVYQVDLRILPTGEERDTFWGTQRQTFVTDEIILTESIETFLMPRRNNVEELMMNKDIRIQQLEYIDMYLASGDIALIKEIYPELRIKNIYGQ
jgi:4-amino-4-deoxy-L-arabinose transferase-like glycosyltransferase